MKIEIHCPMHGKTEEIELPDGYFNFEGEIKCGSGEEAGYGGKKAPYILRIKLAGTKVVEVERAQ